MQISPLPIPSTPREDNYNKHFKNGGAAERVLDVASALGSQQTVMDWMIKPKRRTTDRDISSSGSSGSGSGSGGGAPTLPPIGGVGAQSFRAGAGAESFKRGLGAGATSFKNGR